MTFDIEQFKQTQFRDRTEKVPVPELSHWFPEGETPEFTVRALTGPELSKVREEIERRKGAQKVLAEAEQKNISEAVIAAARVVLGLIDDSIPEEHARIIYMVRIGCVDLKGDLDAAVKLAKERGTVLWTLFMKISELSGRGRSVKKKPLPSGQTPKSETS